MIIFASRSDALSTIVIGVSLLPVIASLYFIQREQFELTAVLLAMVLISMVTLIATGGLGIRQISVLGYPAILIVASLVIRRRTMVLLTLYNIACAAWLVFGASSGAYTPDMPVRSTAGDFFSVTVILILTASMVRLVSESLLQSHRQMQKELSERKQAEVKYRSIVENSIDGIFQSTPNGRFITVNSAMARMYGYGSPEEMVRSVTDISAQLYASPELREVLRRRLLEEERVMGFESLDTRRDGSMFWTSMNVQAIRSPLDGKILYYQGTVEDISGRKAAEDELRDSEERYRLLFENNPLPMWIYDLETLKFLKVNDAAVRHYGYSNDEFMSMTIKDIRPPADVPGLLENIAHVTEGLDEAGGWRHYKKDGTLIQVEIVSHTVIFDGRRAELVLANDVTERRQAEQDRELLIRELEINNIESETLREGFASLVATVEFTEIIQRLLDQMRRVVPYDSASIWRLEGGLQKFVGGRDLPAMFDGGDVALTLDEANSAMPIFRGEVPYILNNNVQEELADFSEPPHNIINSWLALPLKTRGQVVGLIALDGYYRDQFDEHEAELAVTFANQVAIALENARLFSELQNELNLRGDLIRQLESKNAELEQFTYTVSHDLKSPLVTINGFLGYLEQDAESGNIPRLKGDLQRIREAVEKMQRLLGELLELSRIGRLVNAPESIPFEGLVREALEIIHGQLEAGHVTVQLQPNLPAVYGDRQRLVEVLQNLVDNAAKFMGKNENPKIEIGQGGEEDGQPVFFVKDNGIGIAPEHHKLVFDLFNKLDPKAEGTGIGLALVKRIVEVHGGRIWVESESGKGAIFRFSLPRSDAQNRGNP